MDKERDPLAIPWSRISHTPMQNIFYFRLAEVDRELRRDALWRIYDALGVETFRDRLNATRNIRFEPQLFCPINNMLDLFFCRIRF